MRQLVLSAETPDKNPRQTRHAHKLAGRQQRQRPLVKCRKLLQRIAASQQQNGRDQHDEVPGPHPLGGVAQQQEYQRQEEDDQVMFLRHWRQ